MLKELVVLADELDNCGEKEAADIVDNLAKTAIEKNMPPLQPQQDDFEDVPTRVDFEPLPPLRELLDEQQQRIDRTFSKEKGKEPAHKKEDPRDMVSEAIKLLRGGSDTIETHKERIISLLEKVKNSMH
jgi:hypothetical protein